MDENETTTEMVENEIAGSVLLNFDKHGTLLNIHISGVNAETLFAASAIMERQADMYWFARMQAVETEKSATGLTLAKSMPRDFQPPRNGKRRD